ncbi:MAG: MFS transporter [Planctomycetota bacterium]|nr:MFS transporter [Planctomycetota bacterium]
MPPLLEKFLPILLLLVAISVVVRRLPKVDVGHSPALVARRRLNWIPLGLAYAFLYFGRYNLSAIASELDKAGILAKALFNEIDGVGQVVYGLAFLLNGPLTDRFGGRATMLAATAGSAVVNAVMALSFHSALGGDVDTATLQQRLMVLNAINMYFQSFGAVSIVKVNAAWFHVRERGVLGGLFGILISLGLYFSYDWSLAIAKGLNYTMAFAIPACVLGACVVGTALWVRDSPGKAGFSDFNTGDATSGDSNVRLSVGQVLARMLSQRVIWIIIGIEFCSGFLRQAVMKQGRLYLGAIEGSDSFFYKNWGVVMCVAGILGGVFAGTISDHVFGSRRGPVSSVLYAGMLAGAIGAAFLLGTPLLGWSVTFMSLCVIGVHGMLSGTASADFGGTKYAGLVTGVIDGFVYLGGASQAFLYASILPKGDEAKVAGNWAPWIWAMLPVAAIGLVMCATIWNARPKSSGGH